MVARGTAPIRAAHRLGAPLFEAGERLFAGPYSVVHAGADAATGAAVALKRCSDSARARRELDVLQILEDEACPRTARPAFHRLVHDWEVARAARLPPGFDAAGPGAHPSTLVTPRYGASVASAFPGGYAVPQERAAAVARCVLEALEGVHAAGFVHRDIKPANVLRAGGDDFVVIDFGMAMHEMEARGRELVCGTPFYMAPEIVTRGEVVTRGDVFAAGVILFELLHGGEHPLARGRTGVSLTGREICRLSAGVAYDPARWGNPAAPEAADLVREMLRREPRDRPTAREALRHRLFEG